MGLLVANPWNLSQRLPFMSGFFIQLALLSPELTKARREAFKRHFAAGGGRESIWKALGIALLSAAMVIGSAFLMATIKAMLVRN